MFHCVVLIRTEVSEECIASFIRATGIGELGTLEVTSNRSTLRRMSQILLILMMEAIRCSETSVPTRATLLNIPEDGILLLQLSHYRNFSESLSYSQVINHAILPPRRVEILTKSFN
jgi:hypothetical protein